MQVLIQTPTRINSGLKTLLMNKYLIHENMPNQIELLGENNNIPNKSYGERKKKLQIRQLASFPVFAVFLISATSFFS